MVLSLNFILAFVGLAVVLLVSLLIFADTTDIKISVNTDDVNCHVNYDHWSGCNQRTTFDGERGNDSSSILVIGMIVLFVGIPIIIVRLL